MKKKENELVEVPLTKKRSAYIEMINDDGPNRGGFYCRVYNDPEKEFFEHEFVVPRKQLTGATREEKIVQATAIAKSKTKTYFGK